MGIANAVWTTPGNYLKSQRPDQPISFFAPEVLCDTVNRFKRGFPGLTSYAVKANPDPELLQALFRAGIRSFDVASPTEIDLLRTLLPEAVLHYNNPVRSRGEIVHAKARGLRSFSVDSEGELAKLAETLQPKACEISVRLKLPIKGGQYDFGAKFGADRSLATVLLRQVQQLGFTASMTFHPGTQCHKPTAWAAYITAAGELARASGVQIARLNVGGGFPSHRQHDAPNLAPIFAAIAAATKAAFPAQPPRLLCEPGRALVAGSHSLALRVKSIRDDGAIFLNDGLYGALAEMPSIEPLQRIDLIGANGDVKSGPTTPRLIFGPSCDSLDCLPETLALPTDIAEEDYLLLHGMGAYGTALSTGFNGYGTYQNITVVSVTE